MTTEDLLKRQDFRKRMFSACSRHPEFVYDCGPCLVKTVSVLSDSLYEALDRIEDLTDAVEKLDRKTSALNRIGSM